MQRIAIILSFLIPIVFGQCRDGWIQNGTSCYFFNTYNSDTWAASEFDCVTLGGYLCEVDNGIEQQFLRDVLDKRHSKQDPKRNGTYYFLGASDMEVDGNYIWMTSKKNMSQSSFTDWFPGEPNNYRQHEDCLGLGGMFDWHWVDMPCNARVHFICEMPAMSAF